MDKILELSDKRKAKRLDGGYNVSDDDIVLPYPMPNVRLFLKAHYGNDNDPLLIQQGGQFYRYDGTCWPAIEDPILRSQLYRFFEGKHYLGDKGELKPFAPTQRKVADLIDATKALTIIATSTTTPSWRGSTKFAANEIVACSNGLVHWPTRTLLPHSSDFYVHHSVPFAFNATAPQPTRWLAFLNELWGNDAQSIATLQELIGYCLSGDTSQQKMFLLVGPKRGGEGTIARVVGRLLGKHNVAGPTLASLGNTFGLQQLIGKPVAIISDARIGAKSDGSVIAERLLTISGEDMLTVERKFLEPWTGHIPSRFVILSNELPHFTDASGALASRFIVLMLTKSFYGKENPALTDELCAELPGIFLWALEGLEHLRARGRFAQPNSSKEAIQDLEDLASPTGAFIRTACKIGPEYSVDREELYKAYQNWCLEFGHRASSQAIFGRDLRAARPEIRSGRPRANNPGRHRLYFGIKLFTSMDWSMDHVDQADRDGTTVQAVHGPKHSTKGICRACDGKGCPTCRPRDFGIGEPAK
jgi:putative DNA primase/helicase